MYIYIYIYVYICMYCIGAGDPRASTVGSSFRREGGGPGVTLEGGGGPS